MLIPSHRHTPADLDLWAEYEEADRIYADIYADRLTRLERESVDAIREFAARGPCYASVSHGKDSTLLWWMIRQSGVDVPIVHLSITPTRNPHCADVRDAMLRLGPSDYREVAVDYGGTGHAFFSIPWEKATAKRFYGAFAALDKKHGGRHITGIRAAESSRRRTRMFCHGLDTGRTLAPLGWWKTEDVYAYAASRGMPLHPNYAMLGGGRWDRQYLRVAELGDRIGDEYGRAEWEKSYYRDTLNSIG